MAVNVFKKININISPTSKEKSIEWELDNRFTPTSGQYTFYVDYARSGGDWIRLNSTSPVINQNFYTDTTEYKYGTVNDLYYRVEMVDGSSSYYSSPASATGELSSRDFNILRELLRQEYIRLSKSAGIDGYILRKRHWGLACTQCTDYDLSNESTNPDCSYCYGTGVLYGYYSSIPMYMDLAAQFKSQLESKIPTGVEDNIIKQGRCVAYPQIYSGDIWIASKTDTRYVIRVVETAASIKETPAVYNVVLAEIPADRIEYSIPLQTTTSSSSSGSSDITQSWRTVSTDFLD